MRPAGPLVALALALSFAPGCKRHYAAARSTAAPAAREPTNQQRAREFLAFYNAAFQAARTRVEEAEWQSTVDVNDKTGGARVGAELAFAAFAGNAYVVRTARELLVHRDQLDESTARQLHMVLLAAADAPGSNPDLARRRIEAETAQSQTQDAYVYCLREHPPGTPCPAPARLNDVRRVFRESRDLAERERVFYAHRAIGDALRPGLLRLRDLRNDVAREMGYPDFYALQIDDYEMSTADMMATMERAALSVRPLYTALHCYARRALARRYNQPEPAGAIPAHWATHPLAQGFPDLVEGASLSPALAARGAEYVVRTAERYYVSMGFDPLPDTFWTRSDLYPLAPGSTRHKNSHATAWNVDLLSDFRSNMSVLPDQNWFLTTHHELGHIYYYAAYARPEVPMVLRAGANRGFHEAVGDMIITSVLQEPYLRALGLLPEGVALDRTQLLLEEALREVPQFVFAAGVMTRYEHDLYADNLPADELNDRWWRYVRQYQGVVPPAPRDETHCDACARTHVNDDPGQYYDYAVATMLRYQFHEHFCRDVAHADPHACTYYNNRAVGDALRTVLTAGATRDWRVLLREATGAELSADALLRYFEPVRTLLERENAGHPCGWDG